MAPEFYFRGRHGAYEHAVVHGVEKPRSVLGRIGNHRNPVEQKGLMEIMNEELDRDIYRDWLFVLGTVICATKITDSECTICNGNVEFPPIGGWGRDRNKIDGVTPHVQVVGPGVTPEMRNDIEGRTQRVITNLPRRDGPVNFDDANLTNWNRLNIAPKVTVGAGGSVLLYGPYNLPRL